VCARRTPRDRLAADVHHPDVARRIYVAQLAGAFGHAEIVDGSLAADDALGRPRSVFT
jgi:hypothetical protein